MKVKICGLKEISTALAACEAGADLLGFNFYPKSARYIEKEICLEIVTAVNAGYPKVVCVGVFVNHSFEDITETMGFCGLGLAQLSGDETPEMAARLGKRAFKAIRPESQSEAQEALNNYTYRNEPPTLLVDSKHGSKYGGSGVTADWGLARSIAAQTPILLAGGLTPANVAKAVAAVQPWGVDVASGVERERGQKDTELIQAFIHNARSTVEVNL